MENYLDKTSKEITPKLEEVATSLMQKDNVIIEFISDTMAFLDFYSGEFYDIEATNQ